MSLKRLRFLSFLTLLIFSSEQILLGAPGNAFFPVEIPAEAPQLLEERLELFQDSPPYSERGGDFKGLFKYMGQMALQVAMIALMFIPGVGQALGALFQFAGTLFQFAGGFLVGLGSFLGQALSFIPFAGPLLGGLIRGALHFTGGFLQGFGQSLVQIGQRMIQKSNEIFRNLREQGFKYVRDSLTSGFKKLLNQLNPVTYYKNLYGTVTESLHKLGLKGSLSKLLDWAKKELLINFVQDKIDQKLEKSKMNSFLKGILSTVSRAGIEGMVSHLFPRDPSLPRPEPVIIEGPRPPPPTNEPGFFESLLNGAVRFLRDAAGRIQSIFVGEPNDPSSSEPLSPALEDELANYTAELGTDSEGNPVFYKPLGTNAQIEYLPANALVAGRPESLGETPGYTRFDLDGGESRFIRWNPETQRLLSHERVGNLSESETYGDFYREALTDAAFQTGHDLWDVASLGTLSKVERILAENPNASTAELLGMSLWAGFSSVANALTLGYSDAIYNAQMNYGPGLRSIGIGIAENTQNFLPINDFRIAFDNRLPFPDRVGGFFTGVSKTAGLVAGVAQAKIATARGVSVSTVGVNKITHELSQIPGVSTPHGIATQTFSREALAARIKVEQGATLYKIGTIGKSTTLEAQFWALEHPSAPGFASRYGIPPENIAKMDFIETAKLKPGTPFVTRNAPQIGPNKGGGIEVVVPEGSVGGRTFHYLGRRWRR